MNPRTSMKIKHLVFAAITAFGLGANAQNTIGVGVPTGTTRNDTYNGAGFEFYAPLTTGTTINVLGIWDASGTGLLVAHTVSIFKYSGSGSTYNLVISATIPAGTAAPLINGYRWAGIPSTTLPDNGQGGGYYAILATQEEDTWAGSIGSAPYMNPSIGTVSGQGLINAGQASSVLSSSLSIAGIGNPNDGFGGANLAFLTPQPATQPAATRILWTSLGTFMDDTVLGLAGAASNEVYGVDFGGSGLETTTNGYTFDDYATSGNMTLVGDISTYNAYSCSIQWHTGGKSSFAVIILATNTTPASASAAVGSNVVFTAAFSNAPPVNVQWQQVVTGSPNVTNNINAGVVTVTNNRVVRSTLTINNVQEANAGSYQLEAIAVGNSANVAYSAPAPPTVIPLITWYAAGTYNNTFSNDSVLAFADPVSNEVYGVDFGGSGPQTTTNGYTFNDNVSSGNMSVANSPSSYGGYLTGGATTGDTALDTMLAFGLYGETANTGTLNNLTVGQTYTVLVLLDDTRGSAAGGSVFHVTDGATVSPGQQYAFANGAPEVGGYIMGTFTAQATNQPLTIMNVLGAATQYNLVLLETGIALPPPIAPTLTTDVEPLHSQVPVGTLMTFSVNTSGSIPMS